MEEVIKNIVNLSEENELVEQLNNMCLGAYNVQLGTLLAYTQQKIEELQENNTTIEWQEF